MTLSLMDRRTLLPLIGFIGLSVGCSGRATGKGQTNTPAPRPDLYNCEGCDGAFERDAANMNWQARIALPTEPGEAMRIEGHIVEADGQTPASGVVVYAYQTNAEGLYADGSSETEWSRRHGRLRAWVKTGTDGRYGFDTIKPAPYPNENLPAHVHFTILEPDRRPYYIDDIVFDGEFGVTSSYRQRQELRGGSGIVKLKRTAGGSWRATRNIILERHPN
jgi:protocatechuate 3,4-dioxygenase, beta subunit